MCVILTIYQKNPNTENNLILTKKIKELAEYNNDGIGLVAFNFKNDRVAIKRNLKVDSREIKNILGRYNVVNIHLRKATEGVVAKKNVHFWKYNTWLFAHNGVVSDYEKNKDKCNEKMSDSYILFEKLLETNCLTQDNKVNYNRIKKLIGSLSFWGRLVIVNLATKKVYYFGDFHATNLENGTLIVSTQHLNFGKTNRLFGLDFESDLKNTKEIEVEGMFWFNPKKRNFVKISDSFDTTSYYSKEKAYFDNYDIMTGFKNTKQISGDFYYPEKQNGKLLNKWFKVNN